MIRTSPVLRILSSDKNRLIQSSFLLLFVELSLIRWTGANLFFLSFFSNFVLLASFLGMGLGFLRKPSSTPLLRFSPLLLTLLIIFCYHYRYQYQPQPLLHQTTDDLNYMGKLFKENLFPVWLTVPIVFLMTTIVMTTLADGVARTFRLFSSLQAYRLEIIGSLLGMIIFTLLSFLHAAPIYWGIIINLLFSSLFFKDWHWKNLLSLMQIISLILLIVILHAESIATKQFWSPYYKIQVQPYSDNRFVVNVNGVPQQIIESVEQRKKTKPFYFYPYQHAIFHIPLNNVLIVGAGTGGDVAIALSQGAKHVDAVEIDPLLYQLGKKLNPDHAYLDPRVQVTINDGRTFLEHNHRLYDMIIFALPDSLMVLSGQSSLRLENYLFTLEAFTAVKNHLNSNGIFTMYNYYRERWIVDRLAATSNTVFNHMPCVDTEAENNHWLSVLSISPSAHALQCKTSWQIESNLYATPATDNHPFLYLKENRLTPFYFFTLFFIFFTALIAIKLVGGSLHFIQSHFDLFLMGAAFLLLETKNITHFALLFGSTWLVNALVFIGIMLAVYLAVEITHRIPILRARMLYIALLISLFIAWIIPTNDLLALFMPARFIIATLIAFTPIFIANLIFANRFRQTIHSTEAFAANILGAVLGGMLEYSSIIIGYRDLIIVIALLYLLAIMTMKTKAL